MNARPGHGLRSRFATARVSLHPGGTARALFLGSSGDDPNDALPPSLWERLLARDVDPGTLLSAWEVSRWVKAPIGERAALAGLIVALGEAVVAGSSFLSLSSGGAREPGASLPDRLARLGFEGTERAAIVVLAGSLAGGQASPAMAALFDGPGAGAPFVIRDEALYPEALWSCESRVAAALASRLTRRVPPMAEAADSASPEVDRGAGPVLGPEQLAGVRACVTQPLTLITGGPGTGKTSTIVAVLGAVIRRGVSPDQVAIAAPTGRAAQRIGASLRSAQADLAGAPVEVSTLHRLLGIPAWRRPRLDIEAPEFHAGWRLPHRLVIVDEASMIDLFLMAELLAALADDARLVLIGDADQLPSVRLGAVFRELCAAVPELTCRLTTSYRMNPDDAAGAAILRLAHGLQAGLDDSTIPSRRRAQDLAFAGVEHLPRARMSDLIDRWQKEVLGGDAAAALASLRFSPDRLGFLSPGPDTTALGDVLGRHARARLLCVTRTVDGVAGADALNALFHDRLLTSPPLGTQSFSDPSYGFVPGEPVTILHNDHDRGLWNGDQGIVIRTESEGEDALGVAFARGDATIVYTLAEVGDNLGLGFALTVHKAQGSEFEQVALILPAGDGPFLTREILYTALTRASRSVVVVGDLSLFALGAGRKLERASGLGEKLGRGSFV